MALSKQLPFRLMLWIMPFLLITPDTSYFDTTILDLNAVLFFLLLLLHISKHLL